MTDEAELGRIDWARYSHAEMSRMIHTAHPAHLQSRARELDALAAALGHNANAVRNMLDRLTAAWQGRAADRAVEVLATVVRWSEQNATTARGIARGLSRYADAVNHAQQRMRELVDGRPAGSAEVADQLHRHAAEVMRRYEAESAAIHRGLPNFATAPCSSLPPIAAEPPVPVVRYPPPRPRAIPPLPYPLPAPPVLDPATPAAAEPPDADPTCEFAPLSGHVLPVDPGGMVRPAPDGTSLGTSGLAGGGMARPPVGQ